ncbi:hypothetical protein B0H14DRAFT_3730663 [Mycena olivaceomarginata]|nr:hypothetical protein B0H14DRAFT_3730663 [Mycena olivaceomarginata]
MSRRPIPTESTRDRDHRGVSLGMNQDAEKPLDYGVGNDDEQAHGDLNGDLDLDQPYAPSSDRSIVGQSATLYNNILHAANIDAATGANTGAAAGGKKRTRPLTHTQWAASMGEDAKQLKCPTVASALVRIAKWRTEIESDLGDRRSEISNTQSSAVETRTQIETINTTLARHDRDLAALRLEVASLRRANEQLKAADSTGRESSEHSVVVAIWRAPSRETFNWGHGPGAWVHRS